MAGILNHQGLFYQKGPLSTEDFRNSLLSRNLPPPVNETLTQSGLVSKLQDIGNVINVPIFGVSSENIPIHYESNEKMFPLGTFYRTTQNVNLNRFIPQNDDYRTYELTIPPNLGYPTPQEFGDKVKGFYPTSYNSEQFFLVNKGNSKGVQFPFNIIDTYKTLNFQRESSLGLVGGQELEKTIINKIAQIEDEANNQTPSTGNITPPIGKDGGVSSYVNRLRGSEQYFNTLPNGAVGWNEYNQNYGKTSVDEKVGVEPTLGTEIRVNTLLERTNVSQVTFLFDLLKQNTYRPLYVDRRLQGTSEEGTNSRYYIGSEKNTNRGPLITKTFDDSDFNGGPDTSGNQQKTDIDENFFWKTGGGSDLNEKTLLYKTQQLVNNSADDVFINQTKKYFKDKKQDRLISRGNAISPLALIDAEANGNYCRVWTVNDDYNYLKAIRNTGLFSSPDSNGFSVKTGDASLSVLMDNGFPKYHPTKADGKTTLKKYMLSIENLAWADNLADLPLSEIGPGDILSRNKGRIMWFPPYGLSFDENTNANWTTTDFIGRSEPVYTYNNSKRSGQLSFKIVVDHPKVINGYRGKSTDEIERFLAGCTSPNSFLAAIGKNSDISQSTKDEVDKKLNSIKKQESSDTVKQKFDNKPKSFLFTTGSTTPPSSDINSWLQPKVKKWVQDQILSGNKVIITCEGYASKKEKQDIIDTGDDDPAESESVTNTKGTTKKLSKKRAKEVRDLIKAGTGGKGITFKIVAKGSSASTDDELDPNNRRVDVTIENNSKGGPDAEPKKENLDGLSFYPEFANIIDELIIDETKYFDFIDANYPNYFKTISQKIQYFQPGYHSTTPEGLNTRLTFLNQCMRQGPSINNDTKKGVKPQNLAFGRPPVCILRIGDFFHTKVIINSLNITYDDGGIKWDLNPEGIGVQPMIANVQLSVDLIGGQSLVGPIDRLQNAVSFNYYANTQLYDPRADKIDGSTGQIVEGIKLGELKAKAAAEAGVDPNALTDFLKNEGIIDQLEDSETGDDDTTNSQNNIKIVSKSEFITAPELGLFNAPSPSIIIKVLNSEEAGIKPSEVEIEGEVAKDNLLTYKVSVDGKGTISKQDVNDSVTTIEFLDWTKGSELKISKDGESESQLKDKLAEKETDLTTAQNEVEADISVTDNIKEIKKLEKEIEELEKDIIKAVKKQSKVKVTAFFTKNKSGSKQTVEFTYNGSKLI
jgi:hypothetical protein